MSLWVTVTVTAMSALTLWVLFKGYQVATGQSRESAMELVVTALSALLIVGLALQQGGIGLVLSTLIITAPPMAAAFFQGTLGQFTPYSGFGSLGKDPASGKPYTPQAPNYDSSSRTGNDYNPSQTTNNHGSRQPQFASDSGSQVGSGKLGKADLS